MIQTNCHCEPDVLRNYEIFHAAKSAEAISFSLYTQKTIFINLK